MSSETSTDTDRSVRLRSDVKLAPDAAQHGLQPWQFFVLAALGCATAATFLARGQGYLPILLHLRADGGDRCCVGLAVAAADPAARVRPGRSDDDGRAADARGARAREAPGPARYQGARVRPGDGEALRVGLAGDVRPAAGAGRAPDASARRRRRIPRAGRTGTGEAARDYGGRPRRTPAARFCAACGTARDADAKFCKNCGTKL